MIGEIIVSCSFRAPPSRPPSPFPLPAISILAAEETVYYQRYKQQGRFFQAVKPFDKLQDTNREACWYSIGDISGGGSSGGVSAIATQNTARDRLASRRPIGSAAGRKAPLVDSAATRGNEAIST
jgi:hypothetical protein